jgi:hypothetical protein
MKPRQTISLVIALALACLLVAGYKWSAAWRQTRATTLPVPPCNPAERDCRVALPDGGQLTLSITPRPILALQPLNLSVVFSDTRADLVEIDFDGADMSMGYNRPRLAFQGEKFSGTTILPVCITGSMTWKATVLASIGGERIAVPFLFEVAGR